MTVFPGPQTATWWHMLQPDQATGSRRPGDRGALARLRRCATVMDAAAEPATIQLCRRLGAGEAGLEGAALLAAVLAQVRQDRADLTVARQIGPQPGGAAAIMSDLRFRRLLQAETPDERLIAFRRLVALADRRLNVADLAAGLWRWQDEATRRRWIYAYHDAPEPAAQATQTTEDAPP